MREGTWYIRTYTAGAVGEKTKFFVPGARSSVSSRKVQSAIRKQEKNEWSAVKTLSRLLNANYAEGDVLLGLDYEDKGYGRVLSRAGLDHEPDEGNEDERLSVWEAAEQEAVNCLRRVKRLLAKEGVALRYVLVTSDMDGDTGERVRIHHHLVINREAVEAFKAKWHHETSVDYERMSKQKDYTPVAAYLLRQVWHRRQARSYVSSRNLVRPVPDTKECRNGSELRVPRGAELLYRAAHSPGQAQYIRYYQMGKEAPHARPETRKAKKQKRE